MMRQIPDRIKAGVLLIFIILALLLSFLRKPYFILAGVFFFESITATAAVLSLVFAVLIIGYGILMQKRNIYNITRYFMLFLFLNSLINIIALLLISKDVSGFLLRIFGEDVFLGYALVQVLLSFASLILFVLIKRSYRVLV